MIIHGCHGEPWSTGAVQSGCTYAHCSYAQYLTGGIPAFRASQEQDSSAHRLLHLQPLH